VTADLRSITVVALMGRHELDAAVAVRDMTVAALTPVHAINV
jgi:hypothetical protein